MNGINSVPSSGPAAHLTVAEDCSLLGGHPSVLDLGQEALQVAPGLLVPVEAGLRPPHPHARC